MSWRSRAGRSPRIYAPGRPTRALLPHRVTRPQRTAGGIALYARFPLRATGVRTIDHVVTDPRIGVRAVAVHHLRGSDHRPLLAELVLPA